MTRVRESRWANVVLERLVTLPLCGALSDCRRSGTASGTGIVSTGRGTGLLSIGRWTAAGAGGSEDASSSRKACVSSSPFLPARTRSARVSARAWSAGVHSYGLRRVRCFAASLLVTTLRDDEAEDAAEGDATIGDDGSSAAGGGDFFFRFGANL